MTCFRLSMTTRKRNPLRILITNVVSVFCNINIFLLIYLIHFVGSVDDCRFNGDGCMYIGTCKDGVDSYMCECVSGFSGRHCQTTSELCTGTQCSNGGCVNNYAKATYKCFCDYPYQLGK